MKLPYLSDENRGLNLVALGGGTGLSTLLAGLKRLVGDHSSSDLWISNLSAVVTVSDDGGSSGRLRDELQMLPPGDIRNCMIALSEDSNLLSRLFRYRFRGQGELGGHSFGNLFLAALTEVTGDFTEAVRLSSEVLASKGHIYPATISDVRLAAELEDGSVVRGETQISASRAPIRRLRLEPEQCLPLPETLKAIQGSGCNYCWSWFALHQYSTQPARLESRSCYRRKPGHKNIYLQLNDSARRDRQLHRAPAPGNYQELRARNPFRFCNRQRPPHHQGTSAALCPGRCLSNRN